MSLDGGRAATASPSLTIVVPTFRRPEYLAGALDSVVSAAERAPDLTLDVVVSDNASGDDTESVATRDRGVQVSYFRNETNVGVSENIVLAVGKASGDFVMFLSDDDLLTPDALREIALQMGVDPSIGVVTGPVRRFWGDDPEGTNTRIFFQAPTKGETRLAAGARVLEAIFLRSLSLSGFAIRRNLLDADGARRHSGSLYPQVYLAAHAAAEAGAAYLPDPVVMVRHNTDRDWEYRRDYNAGAVLAILTDVTTGKPWGPEARKRVVRKRIRAAYGPLLEARRNSFRSFWQTAKGLLTVAEYRRSLVFWSMVLGIGILGDTGIQILRRVIHQS